MNDLLDKLHAFQVCATCGLLKPHADFPQKFENKKKVLGTSCKACIADAEDEGSGGKQDKFDLDANAKNFADEKQAEHHEDIEQAKEDYIDKIDEEAKKKKDKKFSLFQKDLIDKLAQEKENKFKNFADLDDADTKEDKERSAEFSYDPDLDDPLHQNPNAEHHSIFATHPDRMDVKFLLEYIISGDYAQHQTSQMSGTTRGFMYDSSTPAGIQYQQGNWQAGMQNTLMQPGANPLKAAAMFNAANVVLPPGAPQQQFIISHRVVNPSLLNPNTVQATNIVNQVQTLAGREAVEAATQNYRNNSAASAMFKSSAPENNDSSSNNTVNFVKWSGK